MECLAPIHIKNDKVDLHSPLSFYTVPCGKCEACVKRKSLQWFVRLKYHEMYSNAHCWFITLTYADEHLPNRVEDGFVYHDVCKQDVILFHKRLRKRLGERSKDYSYFMCSEYGGETARPHYHEIAFNVLPDDLTLFSECWNKGFVTISEVTDYRLQYVTGYITEKLFVPAGHAPVFNLISHGLGAEYINKMATYHDRIDRVFVPLNGSYFPMPRYYKERLYNKGQLALRSKQLSEKAEKFRDELIQELGFKGYEDRAHDIRAQYVRIVRDKRNKSKKKS